MDNLPLYHFYEMQHAALSPFRAAADAGRLFFQNPVNPFAHTMWGKSMAAGLEMFERATRRYGKPEWGIEETTVGGEHVPVHPHVVWERPFCQLVHFARVVTKPRRDPKVLIVAPMSGHYATLLRGTVEALIPDHDVYITDWADARMVPLAAGDFDLDDYIDYIISILHMLGGDTHVIGVCQPSVPVMAAVSLMEAAKDPYSPPSMVLMGGPIDTRSNPTAVNKLAQERGIDWFRKNVITQVPFPNPGMMREVYPGFLQLTGFMTMNLDKHVGAHNDMFGHLVRGDGDSAQKHREFYDEYMAVMDLTAEFYLQTVDTVFVRHALPKGEMTHRGKPIDPSQIRNARAAHDRRRERRHLGRRPDRSGAPPMHRHSGRTQDALPATRRRALRRVQRIALPLRDRAAHPRFHPLTRRRERVGAQENGVRRNGNGAHVLAAVA